MFIFIAFQGLHGVSVPFLKGYQGPALQLGQEKGGVLKPLVVEPSPMGPGLAQNWGHGHGFIPRWVLGL